MSQLLIGGSMGGGGGGGSAPPKPVIAPDSLRSQAIAEVVEAICEGEIEGFATVDAMESVYLDDTPLKSGSTDNFSAVSVDYRLGTQNQTYIPGTVDDAAAAPVAVDVVIEQAGPVIRTIDDASTDAIRLTIQVDSLFYANPDTGDRSPTAVQIKVEVKPLGSSWQEAVLNGREIIRGKTESPYERSYHIRWSDFSGGGPGVTSYDVRVTRITADPATGSGYFSTVRWSTYTKLSYAKLRYPNTVVVRTTFDAQYFSKMPSRGYKVKGLKVRVPNAAVYNPVTRIYTGADWDGTFVTAWTRNPAWIFYDLVTNPRYGLGELVNPALMDKWNLYTIAQRCDALIDDGFGGQEHRYSLDLYLQQDDDAKKVILDLASAFDAMAYWAGGAVYTTQDAPKAVAALYVPGNVVNGKFNYAGSARQVRYTVALVQWNDPADNYRIATEYVEDLEGIERYGYREKQIAAVGCTSRGQAHRAGKRILLTSRLETDSVTFSVGLTGMASKPGDIIRVADPLRAGGSRYGGRLSSGNTTTVINLDAPVVLQTGISYKLAVIDANGNVIERTITTAAGTVQTVTVSSGFPAAPAQDMPFIVYDPNAAGKLYRVLTVAENNDTNDGFYSLSAVQYAPEKYDLLDSIGDLPPLPENPYISTGTLAPSGLIIQPGVFMGLEGIRRYLDVSWSASTDKFLSHYVLTWRRDSGEATSITLPETSYRILNPIEGEYDIQLYAVSLFGVLSPSISVLYTLAEVYAIESVSITGLALKTGGTTFSGKSAEFVWSDDALTVLGYSDSYGTGAGGQSPWFRDFQVDVYDGPAYANYLLVGGSITPIRTDFCTEHAYNYTYEKNLEDGGPRRSVALVVRARDAFGRYSIADTIQVNNPQTAAVLAADVDINHGYQSVIISYKRPADNDWLGVIVFMSTTSGFTPARATNQVFIGADTSITITGLTEGTTYYFRIAAYDAFYDVNGTGTDYALTATEFTATVNSVSAAMTPAEIKTGLQTALDAAVDPLVFNTDAFAINLLGTDKPPFIIGTIEGSPAILLDADVGITGTLSASQIVSGTIGATESIAIGNGNAVINGDGSIIVYDGPSTETNRDFAMLSAGTLTFQRYRGGAYREYKSVRRIEYGQANSGDTVTLPGYWDAQPRLIVSPASLQSFNADNVESSQTWTIRAENLNEPTPGSGVWEFDAVAELNYTDAAGEKTVASNSGALTVNGWTSGESILPTGTISATVTARLSSVRGNGLSTYGYFYRSVTWKVQGWDGSLWVDLATKTRVLTQAEHNTLVTDEQTVSTSGYTKLRLNFVASDTSTAQYSQGNNVYEYSTVSVLSNGASVHADSYEGHTPQSRTITGNSYSPPPGWEIEQISYNIDYSFQPIAPESGAWSATFILYGGGVTKLSHVAAWNNFNYELPAGGGYATFSTGYFNATSFNASYWSIYTSKSGFDAAADGYLANPAASVKIRQLQANSSTPDNEFSFQSYSWNVAGSSAITIGALNWMAIGD
jgi:hypothetical protein